MLEQNLLGLKGRIATLLNTSSITQKFAFSKQKILILIPQQLGVFQKLNSFDVFSNFDDFKIIDSLKILKQSWGI